MTALRLGSIAPDFSAETTQGPIEFHKWLGDSWGVLFSHPADFTPVCTTELGEVARRQEDFKARGVKVIGISANGLDSHAKWIEDINEVGSKIGPTNVDFPIIADADRKISTLYDMLDAVDATNVDAKGIPFTIRTVFVVDPKKVIRLTISYPAQTGRSFDEILRVIDSLQLGDKHRITTPVNWKKGDDVIIHPGVSNDEAKTLFPNYVTHKPYLRTTTQPKANQACRLARLLEGLHDAYAHLAFLGVRDACQGHRGAYRVRRDACLARHGAFRVRAAIRRGAFHQALPSSMALQAPALVHPYAHDVGEVRGEEVHGAHRTYKIPYRGVRVGKVGGEGGGDDDRDDGDAQVPQNGGSDDDDGGGVLQKALRRRLYQESRDDGAGGGDGGGASVGVGDDGDGAARQPESWLKALGFMYMRSESNATASLAADRPQAGKKAPSSNT